jgi:hypothetical protein
VFKIHLFTRILAYLQGTQERTITGSTFEALRSSYLKIKSTEYSRYLPGVLAIPFLTSLAATTEPALGIPLPEVPS